MPYIRYDVPINASNIALCNSLINEWKLDIVVNRIESSNSIYFLSAMEPHADYTLSSKKLSQPVPGTNCLTSISS